MDSIQIEDLARLALEHQWTLLTAALIGLAVRALKSPLVPAPLDRIPAKARPLAAILLGLASAGLQHVASGTPWRQALAEGLGAALVAIGGHDLVIEYLRGGREFGAPAPIAPTGEEPAGRATVPDAAPTPRDASVTMRPMPPRLEDIDRERGEQ